MGRPRGGPRRRARPGVAATGLATETGRAEVHLYGRLRRFAARQDVAGESVVCVPVGHDDAIASVMRRIGIAQEETSNLFLNGELSLPTRKVAAGDRLGIFPSDQGLLYRWYFEPRG